LDNTASSQRETTTASLQATQANDGAMRTVTVPVEGMICVVCAGSVKRTLKAIDGVQDAEINLEKRNATIRYEDGAVSVDQLTRAINQLGYKAGAPISIQSQ
jgi:copper chaperone CopZ